MRLRFFLRYGYGRGISLQQEGLETDGAFILFHAENCPRIRTECYFCPGKTFFLRRKIHCGRKYPQNTPYSRRKYFRKGKHPQNTPSYQDKNTLQGKTSWNGLFFQEEVSPQRKISLN